MPPQGTYEVLLSEDYDERDGAWRLLELSDEIIGCLDNGEPVYIKGGSGDLAHVCTEKKTYEVKELENTNLVLFGLADEEERQVRLWGRTTSVFCVTETLPRWSTVRKLMRSCGDVELENSDPLQLEFDAPASRTELEAFLRSDALEVEPGQWRWPSFEYQVGLVSSILDQLTADAEINLESFTVDDAVAALKRGFDGADTESAPVLGRGAEEDESLRLDAEPPVLGRGAEEDPAAFSREVIAWALRRLTAEDEAGQLRLDATLTLRCRGLEVLQDSLEEPDDDDAPEMVRPTSLTLDSFADKVKMMGNVESCETDELMAALAGRAYVHKQQVCLLDVDLLPDKPITRLEHLFALKQRWSETELERVLRPRLGSADLLAFLAKHARASYLGHRDKEVRVFVSRSPGLHRAVPQDG